MKLIIAEKPNMAAEIAACLPGPNKRADGYIETGGGVVTWLFGHILRQAEPEEYDERFKVWRREDLPIIPAPWKLVISDSCKKQFRIVKGLVEKAAEIVHAGDPDREGQLLVDEVLEYLQCSKPVKRILLNSLDEKSIKNALGDLRDNRDFFNLKQSALARSRADWLIGMNLSRAYTLAARKAGHDLTFPIGRVKTPTLALVVRREREIANFQPVTHFGIKATFQHINGSFTATWKPREGQSGLDAEGRVIDEGKATLVKLRMQAAQGSEKAIISGYETEKKSEPQRLPFSLSELQIRAGKTHGYDPQTVLDAAQSLYEKKLTTYPRSDCDYLPESQHVEASVIIDNLKKSRETLLSAWADKADPAIKSRAWNDKKVSAHHAIIPTQVSCPFDKLSEVERNVYFLVAQVYLAQFYPVHTYHQTKVDVTYVEETFKTSGRVTLEAGWKALYGKEEEPAEAEEESATLPAMKSGDMADYTGAEIVQKTTKPPARYTTSTLVEAMKQIHKYVKNETLKTHLKAVSGIGTEATRATIIKELMDRDFLKVVKKHLQPTEGAYILVDALPDELTYPDSTAIWEQTFNDMVDGSVQLENFIGEQTAYISDLCSRSGGIKLKETEQITCPSCGKGKLRTRKGEKGKFWGCSQYPECKATFPDANGKPELQKAKAVEHACPSCKDGKLRLIKGQKGNFWGCTRYPECKASFNDDKGQPHIHKTEAQETKCPICQEGVLRLRKGSNGNFWGCSKYPNCKTTFKDKNGRPVYR